jgi:hypothetical protein
MCITAWDWVQSGWTRISSLTWPSYARGSTGHLSGQSMARSQSRPIGTQVPSLQYTITEYTALFLWQPKLIVFCTIIYKNFGLLSQTFSAKCIWKRNIAHSFEREISLGMAGRNIFAVICTFFAKFMEIRENFEFSRRWRNAFSF